MSYADFLADEPLIVTAALTGGVHGKEANPAIPETPDEIGRAAAAVEDAGASVVHLHARDPSGERSFATERFQAIDDAVRAHADDVVIQHSTGGTGAPTEERAGPLRTDPPPEMASLDMGPLNRYDHLTSENTRHTIEELGREMRERDITPELEVFNNGHLNETYRLLEEDIIEEPPYVNLIFGRGTFAIPSPENVLNAVRNLPEDSIFNVLATGPHQLPLTTQSVLLGGHVRVGLEDNLYHRRGEPATGNPQLVERSANVIRSLDRELATPDEARELLGM